MNTTPIPTDRAIAASRETAAERERRMTREAAMLAEARADAAAGRVVDSAVVEAWIASLDTDHELPVPFSGR